MEWDDDRGLWKGEYSNSGLSPSDVIEFWIYVEKDGWGFYSSEIIEIKGEEFYFEITNCW